MYSTSLLVSLAFASLSLTSPISSPSNVTYSSVHDITRFANIQFENLVVRDNGQILTTTAAPNASIYQVDPHGKLPPTLIYNIHNISSATGITEGKPGLFYVASGDVDVFNPNHTTPASYSITELDLRNVHVQSNGTLSKRPLAKRVTSLPGGALLNGITFARPGSDNLLVADSFRGLIWNVNICNGSVGVALKDDTTRGPDSSGPGFTGVNGIKEHDGILYWTNTGAASMFKVPIDEHGNVVAGKTPALVASSLPGDDFAIGADGTAYVASPANALFRVSPSGEKQVIAGTLSSPNSTLVGPTAVRFGKMAADRRSLYITTNGGLKDPQPGTEGISRVDIE